MGATKSVTLKDVAASAGVSQAVVSTVLNDRANNGVFVSESTRRRVIEAAKTLGYVVRHQSPPPVRRISAGAKETGPVDTRLVGLLLGRRFGGTLFTDIFYGVNSVLTPHGYHPLVLDTYADTYQKAAEKEAEALAYAQSNNFAGLILWHEGGPSNVGLIQSLRDHHFPIVAIDRRVPGVELDYVGTDNVSGAYEATQHLIARGHRRIAHITSLSMTDAASERLAGYQKAMREAGLPTNPRHVLLTMDGSRRLDRGMLEQVFGAPDAPTAVFLLSDYWAPVLYNELAALGLRVPDDIALVGFDDVAQPGLESVGLTSMAQDFEGIGKTAAQMILDRLKAPGKPFASSVYPARLIARQSSAVAVATPVSLERLMDDAPASSLTGSVADQDDLVRSASGLVPSQPRSGGQTAATI